MGCGCYLDSCLCRGKLTPGNEGRLPWRRPLAVIEFVLGAEKPMKLGLNEKGGWSEGK